MKKYILTIDQGTTSSRAILFDDKAHKVASKQLEFRQLTPKSGWVLHNPDEIYITVLECIHEVLNIAGATAKDIECIGITNQRETTVIWDKNTGRSVYPAIVWQSRQSEDICEDLIAKGYKDMIHEKTGLLINPYFSASKIKWIFDNVKGVKERKDELLCGTIDTYLLYRLSEGAAFKTDYTNASRTMLFNIKTLEWDQELMDLFEVPKNMLPEVCDCSSYFGDAIIDGVKVPVTSMIGDQQSSLFGHTAYESGDTKITYGTGCFMLMNTKDKMIYSKNGLLTTIAYKFKDTICYALEGSVFVAGSAIQWLRDGIKVIKSSGETQERAESVSDSLGVYFVPAFVGLGSPYWDNDARGAFFGLSRGTTENHIVRATLEAICYEANDVLEAMTDEAGMPIHQISVDGGASVNNFLVQFESDITQTCLIRPKELETTALGATYLAGLHAGFFESLEQIKRQHEVDQMFFPTLEKEKVEDLIEGWKLAVAATRMFKRKSE